MDRVAGRLRMLALLVALMFVALTTRLWFLQVLATDDFTKAARSNSVRFVPSDALRGNVYTDDGFPLVKNQLSLEVRVIPEELARSGRSEEVLYELAQLLDRPVRDIRMALEDKRYYDYQPKPVAEFVDEEAWFYISEHPREFPGVEVVQASVREYPQARTAAHILGSLNQIQAEELEDPRFKNYGTSDLVGRSGLEQTYERWLRGTKGLQKFIVNSNNETIRALARLEPEPGHDLHLTMNLDIQQAAEEELRAGMERARQLTDSSGRPLQADGGVAIVLDAKDGGVKAMASVPSFDPAWYVRGLTRSEQKYVRNDDLAPLLNRATQAGYFPGSTFKSITALTAVNDGIASLSGSYPCTATYVHPSDESGASFSNWTTANLGYMSIAESLRISCDTVYYGFGSDYYFKWRNAQLGAEGEAMQQSLREWGFGSPTGIDQPQEGSGLVPDAAWAAERPELFENGTWIPAGNILTMIGSSYMQATPLQLARSYQTIASDGRLCRPRLVDTIVDADGNVVKEIPDRCERRLPGYTKAQFDYIHRALLSVTSSGTAACAFSGFPLSQIPVAGKTGTAEWVPRQDISWFASIVGPVDDPDYVVVAMVEQGGFGSQTAAPIVRHIVERIYGLEETGPGVCGNRED
jgi:penicillin-binding protein 2